MKPRNINKLYSKLTPQEQAALVIEAASRLDESDIDAILEHVERKTYLSAHADYTRRICALQTLIGQYGIEYWKNRALMLLAVTYAEDGREGAETTAMQFLATVVALESAIVQVCNHFKVDVAAIKKMAGCPGNDAKPSELPLVDAALVKRYIDLFTSLAI